MAKLTGKEIQEQARTILASKPDGLKRSMLHRIIAESSPETPPNTIDGNVHKLLSEAADVRKIARGVYTLDRSEEARGPSIPSGHNLRQGNGLGSVTQQEDRYYQPFADWLRDDQEEVTEAMALGGNVLKGKWGTPDVIGVLKPQTADLVKFSPQIVSAEIKIDISQTVVAFGQAVSYRLFSHKSYIVIPAITSKGDVERLEALAIITGIGLVTFALEPTTPNFRLLVPAVLTQPDMYYVNEMARSLSRVNPKDFNRLF